MKPLRVGVIGATGMVGQHYVALLQSHPWFQLSYLAASDQSLGKSYGEAVARRWHSPHPLLGTTAQMRLRSTQVDEVASHCDLIFSCASGDTKALEEAYARAHLFVSSNTSSHRRTSDVPLLIPEINSDHLSILSQQRSRLCTERGAIVVKPNCSLQSYLIPLYPLHQRFGLKKVVVTTLQALSGAGHPGVSALDILDNAIPFIDGEEEKSEWEPLKVLGRATSCGIALNEEITISAHCNRIPAVHGHMACISFSLEKCASFEEIIETWQSFRSLPQELGLPFAPQQPLIYRTEADRPQTRLDREAGNGMSVTVGRLRPCHVLDWRCVGLSHNVVRGAAGGGILNAELLYHMHHNNQLPSLQATLVNS